LLFAANRGAAHGAAHGRASGCTARSSVDERGFGPHARGVKPVVVAKCRSEWHASGLRPFGYLALAALAVVVWFALRGALAGGPIVLGGVVLAIGLVVTLVGRALAAPGLVIAGDDGVAIVRRRTRFLSYAEIARVLGGGERIALARRAGALVQIRLADVAEDVDAMDTELVRRMQEGLARPARVPSPGQDALARRGRASRDWLASITGRATSTEGYRDQALDRDALRALACDGPAEPSARAAAAFVLRTLELSESEREDLRSAAAATAHPELRDALAVLSDPAAPDDAIARVMAAVR
jgi:hypothetical protein